MKDWKIKRFCLFIGPEYDVTLGLGGLVHSTDTLTQMKKWLLKNITEDEYCFEWWQIDDMKKCVTVMSDTDPIEFVWTLFQMRSRAHLKMLDIREQEEIERRARTKDPKRLP